MTTIEFIPDNSNNILSLRKSNYQYRPNPKFLDSQILWEIDRLAGDFLPPRLVAPILGVSIETLRRWIRGKSLPTGEPSYRLVNLSAALLRFFRLFPTPRARTDFLSTPLLPSLPVPKENELVFPRSTTPVTPFTILRGG